MKPVKLSKTKTIDLSAKPLPDKPPAAPIASAFGAPDNREYAARIPGEPVNPELSPTGDV